MDTDILARALNHLHIQTSLVLSMLSHDALSG